MNPETPRPRVWLTVLAAAAITSSLLACDGGASSADKADKSAPAASEEPGADGRGSDKAEPDKQAEPEGPRPAAFTLEFEDPPPGRRAPTSEAFHAAVGKSTLAEIEALGEGLGLPCGDTSIRSQMKATREAKIAEAKAAGKDMDAISSASWAKPSKREDLPQVRYSCTHATGVLVDERERPPSQGRLLYVFDSAELPLRHTSYQRSHREPAAAYADVSETLEHMRSVYGEPTKTRNSLPVPAADGTVDFELLENVEFVWEFSDLLVKVSALRVSATSVSVGERVEVPIGVRPDAPFMAKADEADEVGSKASPEPAPEAEAG